MDDVRYQIGDRSYRIGDEVRVLVRPISRQVATT
jgi:hypothetical protein